MFDSNFYKNKIDLDQLQRLNEFQEVKRLKIEKKPNTITLNSIFIFYLTMKN